MGMFDDIYVSPQVSLPDYPEHGTRNFQTKSLDSAMNQYHITRDGKLVEIIPVMREIPESARKKSKEDDSMLRALEDFRNSYEQTGVRIVDTMYHGDIFFYGDGCVPTQDDEENEGYEWYEFHARFTSGVLSSIVRETRQEYAESIENAPESELPGTFMTMSEFRNSEFWVDADPQDEEDE